MPNSGIDDQIPTMEPDFATGGSMARARRRRLIVLGILIAALVLAIYVAFFYSQNRRLPIPRVVSSGEKVAPPQFQRSFSGINKQAMTKPTGIAIIDDKVYVTDFAWRTIRAYNDKGDYLFQFGPIASEEATRLQSPVHIAAGPDKTVWVSDRRLKDIFIFGADGKYLRTFEPNGDPDFAWSPLAMTFGPEGNLYVTDVGDSKKHRVLVFKPDGTLVTEWGRTEQVAQSGAAPGSFLFPNGIAVSGKGDDARVFVADGNNRRIQIFRTDGTFMKIINSTGTPRGMVAGPDGRVYVVDALAHRVDVYSPEGAPLANFGENGVGPGQLSFPNDIAVANGRLYVTDRENNQVQVWGYTVAEIPGVTRISEDSLLPYAVVPAMFVFVPFWIRRRRRFVVTPDFVESMVEDGQIGAMAGKNRRWIMTAEGLTRFAGSNADGVSFDELLSTEPYSTTEAAVIRKQLDVSEETAVLLSMAKRYKNLCTENPVIARKALALGIDVYDRTTWLARFKAKTRKVA